MSSTSEQPSAWRGIHLAVTALWIVCACGSDGGDDGSGGSGGSRASGGAGAAGGDSSSGGTGSGGDTTCSRFEFVASGTECPSTGCAPVSCACEAEGFPVSITTCSADGCLVAGDCDVMCPEDLSEIFECTDTYSIAPGGGGAGGGGGTAAGGSAGTAGSGSSCAPEQVSEPPETVTALSESLVTAARAIVDGDGNVYVAGHVSPSIKVDFGGGEHDEYARLFLLKLDATGNYVWSRRFGTADLSWPERITTFKFADDGDLLLGGSTVPETDLGNGPEAASLTPQHFVVRYDTDGTFIKSYLLPTNDYKPELVSVVEMPSGELHFWGTFDHPFQAGEITLTPAGTMDRDDIYVVRFSADGEILGAVRYGGTLDDSLFDVVADESGNSYLIGAGYNQLSFGGDDLDLGSDGMSYAVALGPALSLLWQKTIGGPKQTYPRRALLDGTALVVAGDSSRDADLHYDSAVFGKGRVFLLHVDIADGSLLQGDGYEPMSSSATLQALGVASDGDVVIGGTVNPPADFGGGEVSTPFSNQPFLARFGEDGEHRWSTLFCTAKGARIVAVDEGSDSSLAILQFSGGGVLELGSSQITQGGALLLEMPEGK